MRNQQAARYARWAGIAAGSIALLVVGIYAERAIRASRQHHEIPAAVPASVQQQTQTFTYKRVVGERTIFTIRASKATQFKEGDQAILEDVWITIYGPQGDRNDNIHTRKCSYNQKTGNVQCKGELTIDIAGANPTAKPSAPAPSASSQPPVLTAMQIKTSNLTFDGQTGEASTPAAVDFTLPQGHGHGVGVIYSTQKAILRVEHAVEFEAAPSERTSGAPVSLKGSSLEIRRNDGVVTLGGPATVREGDRELSADKISVDLDETFHARHVLAEGHPSIHGTQGAQAFSVAAATFEGFLNPEGWVERIVANGGVTGSSKSSKGTENFSSARVDVSLEPQHNVLREMLATGGVSADSEQNGVSQRLQTQALRVKFASAAQPDHQHIESAETLAPGVIESKNGDATTELRAPKFETQFTNEGHLARLVGSGGVEVRNRTGASAPQVSTAQTLNAAFAPDGQWTAVDEQGDVHFKQADKQATAAHANIDRAADQIVLSGSPVVSDEMSRTTARTVTIGQKSGKIDAEGGVISTYLPSVHSDSVNLGSGPAHITAETLSGSTTTGRVVYSGHARLWQGESVLDADQITLWRDEKKMEATGNVVAVFPQTSGPTLRRVSEPVGKGAPRAGTSTVASSGPSLWHVRAPELTYWNDQNKARLEGGVTATSEQGSIESRTLDVYLGPTAANGRANDTAGPEGVPAAAGQLNRVVAQGAVTVSQGDRRGSAEQGEYTAADQRFVLSGGQPTLTDGSGNTTTGRSLTFFVASDTILIDSQAGSRTLTKHRVEK